MLAVLTDADWLAHKYKDLPSAEMQLKKRDGSPMSDGPADPRLR